MTRFQVKEAVCWCFQKQMLTVVSHNLSARDLKIFWKGHMRFSDEDRS